jgi:hypothetical protein
MTHGWLHEGEAPEAVDARATRITVDLFDEGPRTPMVFVQRGLPTPESYPRTATTRGGGAPSVSSTPSSSPRGAGTAPTGSSGTW